MKTETLLLYSCLSLALLSLLGQIVMMVGQRHGNSSSNLRKSSELPLWIKEIPLNTWIETSDHKICGWLIGRADNNEILLKTDLERIIYIPIEQISKEAWIVAPYPHIRLFSTILKCDSAAFDDLTAFFEQEVSVLQRPKFSIQMNHSRESHATFLHIQAWVLESQWLDFQHQWVLQNKLQTKLNQRPLAEYHA